MPRFTGFVAYPSKPIDIASPIQGALTALRSDPSGPSLRSWEENDIAGRFIVTPILSQIDEADVLVADITCLNFNVIFEIGYPIGRRKRAYLIRNSALVGSDELVRQVGIFDTLGYRTYSNSSELTAILKGVVDAEPLPIPEGINAAAPVYLVMPRQKTDKEIRLRSRLKKARQTFRSFDPEEVGRLTAGDAIENVAQSHGVIVPLLSKHRT